MTRNYSQMREGNDKDLLGITTGCHIAGNPTLITEVEHALDGETTIDAHLYSSASKCSDDLHRRKRWNWQLVLHLLHQPGNRAGGVDHRHASLRFTVAACQHARTHCRSVSERTRSGTSPSITACAVCQPASPR